MSVFVCGNVAICETRMGCSPEHPSKTFPEGSKPHGQHRDGYRNGNQAARYCPKATRGGADRPATSPGGRRNRCADPASRDVHRDVAGAGCGTPGAPEPGPSHAQGPGRLAPRPGAIPRAPERRGLLPLRILPDLVGRLGQDLQAIAAGARSARGWRSSRGAIAPLAMPSSLATRASGTLVACPRTRRWP